MKKFFASTTIITKFLLLVIFSGMHFFQVNALANMPCHINNSTTEFEIQTQKNNSKCKLCENSEEALNQIFIFCSELKEKKILKNNFNKFLRQSFSQNNSKINLLGCSLKKSETLLLSKKLKNYLSFKKSVELRV